MKSLMLLTQRVLHEFGEFVCTSTIRDSQTISERFEHEGVSFLTITLPDFASDFQKSLERGKVENDVFLGFSNQKGLRLPAFLQGFASLVFDPETGVLHDTPNTEAIRAIRQICLLHGKVLLPCSDAREKKAFRSYYETEAHVKEFDSKRTPDMYSEFTSAFSLLFGDVVQRMDNYIYHNEPVFFPKHGPGTTSERILGNKKFYHLTWPSRLEDIFPQRDYIIPSERYYEDVEHVRALDPGDEIPVRVISVPKTLKTRRIIAIEPVAMQYMQQALMTPLVDGLEASPLVGPLIGFTDQEPNKALALEGSLTGKLATLDLSSASDLVSNQLVRAGFARFPHFSAAIDATRSRKADVPGYGVIRLAKYASMGSALCFPIEAMIFLTTVFIGIAKSTNSPLSRDMIKSYHGRVRVYGDDIIVPVDHVQSVIASLEAFGFLVSHGKSFWSGMFRESCGGDYYSGEDVTAIRCRRTFPTSRTDAEGMVSLVSLRNQCYKHGLWKTASWLDDRIVEVLPHFPTVHETSSVVGRHTFLPVQGERECSNLHHPLVRGYVVSSKPPLCEIDGPFALLKFFLKQGDKPYEEGHLRRSGRPDAVYLKLRWSRPY